MTIRRNYFSIDQAETVSQNRTESDNLSQLNIRRQSVSIDQNTAIVCDFRRSVHILSTSNRRRRFVNIEHRGRSSASIGQLAAVYVLRLNGLNVNVHKRVAICHCRPERNDHLPTATTEYAKTRFYRCHLSGTSLLCCYRRVNCRVDSVSRRRRWINRC